MKNIYCVFPMSKYTLLAGLSWIFAAVTTTWIGGSDVAVTAFVGTNTGRRHKTPLPYCANTRGDNDNANNNNHKIPASSSSVLFGTTVDRSSQSPAVLEGKLTVLQDVVKQLEARRQHLREELDAAHTDYQRDLESVRDDLTASEAALAARKSALDQAQRNLDRATEIHAADLESTKEEGRQATERALADLTSQHERELEELRKDRDGIVGSLRDELAVQETRAEELSAKWSEADKEATSLWTEKDRIIEELRLQLEQQETQIATLEKERDEKSLESASASNKNDDSEEQKSRDEAAITVAAEERLADLRADLESRHRDDIEERQSKINEMEVDNQKIVSQLAEMSEKCDEKIAIATASVKAGETREANLRTECDRLQKENKHHWLLARMATLASERIDEDNRRLSEEHLELSKANEALADELEEVHAELEWLEKRSQGRR